LNISPSELLPGIHHRKKDHIKTAFGKHLKRKREELGLTQEELAEQAGLDLLSLAFLEQGKGNISLENIISLAQVLKLSLKDLMPDNS